MGFFQIISNFFGITPKDQRGIQQSTDTSKSVDEVDVQIQELDKTIKQLKSRKKYSRTDNVNWDSISQVPKEEPQTLSIFQRYSFGEIITLAFLKQERIRKEKERIEKLTLDTANAISQAHAFVRQKDLNKASELAAQIRKNMGEVQDANVKTKYKTFLSDLNKLREEVRKAEEERRLAELKRQEEERKRREEEERKRREEEERRAVIERERQERERREREQREAERLAEARRKEEAEMAEKRRLEAINSELKDEANDILNYLKSHGVRYFYHFTDRKNLQSIRRRGGLLSWKYCEDHNITIPNPGGGTLSRNLDRRHRLEDYVRVSFCDDHPMAYRCHQEGADLVLLRISIDVATFKNTIFSDMNATDNNHSKGPSIDDLYEVDIRATQRNFVSRSDDDFGPHQAEVLIKTFVPIKYILNIDNPPTMHFG